MNCGDPNDTNCAEVLQRMMFFIDNELADADSTQIKQHLDDCAPCLDEHEMERVVKAVVARSCSEHAPEELRQRVIFRIREVEIRLSDPMA
jgi:mycothiol system anti-sigma-R factor